MNILKKEPPLRWILVYAFCVGIGYAWLYFGSNLYISDPFSFEYKVNGDRAQHLSGAFYFVQDDWRLPLFNIKNMGFLHDGGNLIYSDGIPIIAPFFKILHKIYPKFIDYYGLWLFFAYGMQAFSFAWLLNVIKIKDWLSVTCGILLVLSVPPFLLRYGHIALNSHFLIIFAIGLTITVYKSNRFTLKWLAAFSALLIIALFTHAYLFAMVFGFFVISLIQHTWDHKISLTQCASLIAVSLLAIIGLMMLSGYIEPGREMPKSGGFGYYSMNLAGPFWPQTSAIWPSVMPLNGSGGQGLEGMNYMGTGLLVLTLLTSILIITKHRAILKRGWIILLYVIFLSTFAVTHNIWLFDYNLATFNLPFGVSWDAFFGSFRSSGRMFWPVIYLILTLSFYLFHKLRHATWAKSLLVLAALLQLLDASYFFQRSPAFPSLNAEQQSEIKNLSRIISEHDYVFLLPGYAYVNQYHGEDFTFKQYLSALNNKPVSNAYQARGNYTPSPAEAPNVLSKDTMKTNALFVLYKPWFSANSLLPYRDALQLREFAHGYYASNKKDDVFQELDHLGVTWPLTPTYYPLGKVIKVREDSDYGLYIDGINGPWTDGSWSRSDGVTVTLPILQSELTLNYRFRLRGHAFTGGELTQRVVDVSLNGKPLTTWTINQDDNSMRDYAVTLDATRLGDSEVIQLSWQFRDQRSPQELGISQDTRRFGFWLQDFSLDAIDSQTGEIQSIYTPGQALDFSASGDGCNFTRGVRIKCTTSPKYAIDLE